MGSPSLTTVRARLARLIITASLLALAWVVVAGAAYELVLHRPLALERLRGEAEILAEVLRAPLTFEDNEKAGVYLGSRRDSPRIAVSELYDSTGRLFAFYRRAGLPPPPVDIPAHRESGTGVQGLEVWFPVAEDARTIGVLHLVEDLAPIPARLSQYGIMVTAVALALLILGTTLMRGVRREFLRPISDLLGTTTEVTRTGRLDLRAPFERPDELGRLAEAFNRMLDMIGERDAALRATTAQIRGVFSAATEVAVVATRSDGTVTLFNTGAELMLGYSAAEIVGLRNPLLWHLGSELEERANTLSSRLGRPVSGFAVLAEPVTPGAGDSREWTFVRKDARLVRVHQVITAVRDGTGEATGYLAIATDITDRQRAARELQLREERFRSLIENASDMITVVARDGTITFQSPSSGRVLGLGPSELLGRNAFSLVHPDDLAKAAPAMERALLGPEIPEVLVLRLRHRDGSWRRIEIIGRPTAWEPGSRSLVLNSRDITETTLLEEQLRQSQKMEAIGKLSGGVAHDFNNILTVIQGHVSLVGSHPDLPPELRESALEIDLATRRASNLTRQLLAFSRRQPLQPTDVDLNDLVANMARMLHRILGEDIRMRLDCCAHPAWIRADGGMIEQVLLNLVVNARDAMPRGGTLDIGTIWAEVDPSAAAANSQARPGGFVVLSVTDSGTGISADDLPKIFEPFFTTKDVGKGTGLGLATVYGIIQQHQGWITVDSEPGEGTRFRIHLPRVLPPVAPVPAGDARPPRPGPEVPPVSAATILVAEDEPALRNFVRTFLTRHGYTVLEADTGAAALELWRQHRDRISLLLTDLVMPEGMTGRQLAELLVAESPDLPVIYTSGYSAEVAGGDLLLREGVNFLAKPYESAALVGAVRRRLGQGPSKSNVIPEVS